SKDKMPAEECATKLAELGLTKNLIIYSEPPADIQKMIGEFRLASINNIVFDPSIVRGFAYYTGVVFEVFDTHPDNNRALFGGGRYDGLTQLFDDEPLSAVGCAMGDETMRLFLESRGLLPAYMPRTVAYIALPSPEMLSEASRLAGELRAAGVAVALDFGERRLGEQIKAATKAGIPYLVVVGPDEVATGTLTVRDLRSGDERPMPRKELPAFFQTL